MLGSLFIWILLPWLSFIDQSQADTTSNFVPDFRQIAPLNIFYALCASASTSFSTSIWLRSKIAIHDIIFSCFTVHYDLFRELLLMGRVRMSFPILGLECSLAPLQDLSPPSSTRRKNCSIKTELLTHLALSLCFSFLL